MGYHTRHKPKSQMSCAHCKAQEMVSIKDQKSARGPRCSACGGPMHRTEDEGRINRTARKNSASG